MKLLAWSCVGLAVAGTAYWISQNPSVAQFFTDSDALKQAIDALGVLGPLAIIVLMTLAVVFSPIPSAPIAMVSGAIYGHLIGAVYVIIGAEAGALIAFFIARAMGRDHLIRWFGSSLNTGLLGSQNALMFVIFASRLMPFVSFDLMSYAAGLSALKLWRFAIATFAGIIPASLFLTHFGGALATGNSSEAIWSSLALGAITGLPLIYVAVQSRRKKSSK
jgi:uncharacterized membrane protein YdjX (TVP38/TMEM64 family)